MCNQTSGAPSWGVVQAQYPAEALILDSNRTRRKNNSGNGRGYLLIQHFAYRQTQFLCGRRQSERIEEQRHNVDTCCHGGTIILAPAAAVLVGFKINYLDADELQLGQLLAVVPCSLWGPWRSDGSEAAEGCWAAKQQRAAAAPSRV